MGLRLFLSKVYQVGKPIRRCCSQSCNSWSIQVLNCSNHELTSCYICLQILHCSVTEEQPIQAKEGTRKCQCYFVLGIEEELQLCYCKLLCTVMVPMVRTEHWESNCNQSCKPKQLHFQSSLFRRCMHSLLPMMGHNESLQEHQAALKRFVGRSTSKLHIHRKQCFVCWEFPLWKTPWALE